MNPDQFINTYQGKHVDFDHVYGYTCMDLYQQYNKEVVGAPQVPANAAQVWDAYPTQYYTRVANTPTNVPPRGAVIIFKGTLKYPEGHIAIVTAADVNKVTVLEQDGYTQTVASIADHDYSLCIGWLIPNKLMIQPTGEMSVIELSSYRKRVNDTITNVIAMLKSLQ